MIAALLGVCAFAAEAHGYPCRRYRYGWGCRYYAPRVVYPVPVYAAPVYYPVAYPAYYYPVPYYPAPVYYY